MYAHTHTQFVYCMKSNNVPNDIQSQTFRPPQVQLLYKCWKIGHDSSSISTSERPERFDGKANSTDPHTGALRHKHEDTY